MSVSIDLATVTDIPRCLELANLAARLTPANFATEPELESEWVASWQSTERDYPWLVARSTDATNATVGFAKAGPHHSRGAYRWTTDVTVYVDPENHAKGIGRALYGKLIPMLCAQGFVLAVAGITLPNPASERLHESFGFVRCGVLRRAGWKFERWHDVGYWECLLQPPDHLPTDTRPVRDVWIG